MNNTTIVATLGGQSFIVRGTHFFDRVSDTRRIDQSFNLDAVLAIMADPNAVAQVRKTQGGAFKAVSFRSYLAYMRGDAPAWQDVRVSSAHKDLADYQIVLMPHTPGIMRLETIKYGARVTAGHPLWALKNDRQRAWRGRAA